MSLNAPSGVIEQLEAVGRVEAIRTDALMVDRVCPQYSFGSIQFSEFPLAVSQSIGRELIVQPAVDGRLEVNIWAAING